MPTWLESSVPFFRALTNPKRRETRRAHTPVLGVKA